MTKRNENALEHLCSLFIRWCRGCP